MNKLSYDNLSKFSYGNTVLGARRQIPVSVNSHPWKQIGLRFRENFCN